MCLRIAFIPHSSKRLSAKAEDFFQALVLGAA
jgi:hypothetical protein